MAHPGTLRRSNKIRQQMMNITSPMLSSHYSTDTRGMTPVDPIPPRPKNVTWSPKVVQKTTPTPPARSETTRVTTVKSLSNGHGQMNGHGLSNGLELDPDTSVTPLETYRSHQANGRHNSHPNPQPNSGTDTMHSNSSLTLYF